MQIIGTILQVNVHVCISGCCRALTFPWLREHEADFVEICLKYHLTTYHQWIYWIQVRCLYVIDCSGMACITKYCVVSVFLQSRNVLICWQTGINQPLELTTHQGKWPANDPCNSRFLPTVSYNIVEHVWYSWTQIWGNLWLTDNVVLWFGW